MVVDGVIRRFQGRRALVTGGAGVIGRAVALRLVAEGADVVVWDRDEEAIRRLLDDPAAAGRITAERVDVTDPAATAAAAARLLAAKRGLDVLINNAGGGLDKAYSLMEQSEADWRATIELNLMTAMRVSKALVGAMAAARYGRIVNVGSKAGRYASYIDGPAYVAAKGALHAFTLSLAMEFGPAGITCNAVCPGIIMSERVRRLWESRRSPEERETIRQAIPLRRHGEASDVAGVVAFLASDDAAFVTGTLIDVNGGQAMAT